jgi:hypothetical protein
VTFDRFLLPTTTFRQSICVQAGVTPVTQLKDCANPVFLEPSYDPVRRRITFRQPATSAGLAPSTHYTVSVFPPPDDGISSGVEAFDGAPLEHAASRTFTTRDVEPAGTLPDAPPTVDFCKDLYPNILSTTCASNGCHTSRGPDDHGVAIGPAEGLDFSSHAKITATAVNHVAHETQTGEHAATIEVSPALFGRAMPILDPTRPGNSYALYKLLAATDNGAPGATPALEKQRLAEIARLREAIIVGMPMPPANGQMKALPQARLEQISDWVAAGAPTTCP